MKNALSTYNRIAILRGYSNAVNSWQSERFGAMIEIKTHVSQSHCFRAQEIQSIEFCEWDSSRIFGQRFAVVTLKDGERIQTGATVGEIKHALKGIES